MMTLSCIPYGTLPHTLLNQRRPLTFPPLSHNPHSCLHIPHPLLIHFSRKWNTTMKWGVPVNFFWPRWGHFLLLGSSRVSHLRVWKISLKNLNFFNFFTFRSKKFYCDWFKKYPGQSWIGPLFTAGQKYACAGRVRSGPISDILLMIPANFTPPLNNLHPWNKPLSNSPLLFPNQISLQLLSENFTDFNIYDFSQSSLIKKKSGE